LLGAVEDGEEDETEEAVDRGLEQLVPPAPFEFDTD
jgi:hypothetical protein